MKNHQLNNPDHEKELPARIDKALAWLSDSRNNWRKKCKTAKLQLKRQTFAIKRLKDGRDSWKFTCSTLKQEVIKSKQKISTLQQRVDELELQTENYRKENQVLKKKP